MKSIGPAQYREMLLIDQEDLEGCLVSQVQTFWDIASKHVEAQAHRDGLKLKIEELHAALDQQFRAEAATKDGKTTEAGLAQRIKDDADMRGLRDDHLAASRTSDEWSAMKEAFYQRGYMLRELVQLALKKMAIEGDIQSTERSSNALREKQADKVVERVKAAREARVPSKKPVQFRKR